MLVLIFGNTAHSTIIILSVFMAGLSFGSFLFGQLADRTHYHLLKLYALIELGMGILAGGSLQLINLVNQLFAYHPTSLTIKLAATFLLLFPVTTLIGATLPITVKYLHHLRGQLSQRVGQLYAVNTAGAVLGTLLAGFVLIELFGLRGALLIGVGGNFFVASLIWWSARNLTTNHRQLPLSFSAPPSPLRYSPFQITLLMAVFSLSGLISLAYEVILVRLITPSMGTFIYGFSASLAIYLLGLAVGSALYQRFLFRQPATLTLVGFTQLAISLLSFFIIGFITYLIPLWLPHPLIRLIAPLIVFLPLTVILGIIFPAVTKVFETRPGVAASVGLAYALNSLGSIFGSIIAGFVLIPVFGSVAAVFILAIVNGLLGLGLLLSQPHPLRLPGIVLAGLILGLSIFGLNRAQTIFLPRYLTVQLKHHLHRWPDTRFTLEEDVVASVLAITSQSRPGRSLLIDGVGTTSLSEETKILAHLPLLIHPQAQDILVIALGMGTTFRSSLSYPQARVDVVELVPSVAQVMPYFHQDANQVLANPRGQVIINDGRNYVFTTTQKYDVVTIDPPPPDNAAGTTVLFSSEFYRDIKRALKPGGLVGAWFHFDLDVASYKMVLQSYLENFPSILAFKSPRHLGLYLIGSSTPIKINSSQVATALSYPSVVADMTEWQPRPYDIDFLQFLYLGDQDDLKQFVGQTSPVTDYYPRSEYFLLRQLFQPSPLVSQEIINQFFTAAR